MGLKLLSLKFLTVAYFHYAKKIPENINLIEAGLFHDLMQQYLKRKICKYCNSYWS